MTAPKGINWESVPLGRYSDADLARRLMTTRQAVCQQRNARGIPAMKKAAAPFMQALSPLERDDLLALDEAVTALTAEETVQLTFKITACISLVSGWRVTSRHVQLAGTASDAQKAGEQTSGGSAERQSGGDGKDRARARATGFRILCAGTRQWSSWMDPKSARTWLLQRGWADQAASRIAELRARTTRAEAART